jgi:predicted AAA+ superfamily ATPase
MRNYLLYGRLEEFSISDIYALVENFIYNELSNKQSYSLNIYQTISQSEIDFIFSKSYNELIPIEVKYRNKINFPIGMKNFEANYQERINKKIIFTKNLLKQEENTYYVPSSLV